MKKTSVYKNDKIEIPKEIKHYLDLKYGDNIAFEIKNNSVIITKAKKKKSEETEFIEEVREEIRNQNM